MNKRAKSKMTDTAEDRQPVMMVRSGRGRLGGSGMLLYAIQRARAQGRRVKPMDGDLKSRTLFNYYPGNDEDGCSCPETENSATFKDWILAGLDQIAEDRVSRVVDISGGDRVFQEFLQDLRLGGFCDSLGIRFVNLCMIGPDAEDFRHIVEAVEVGDLEPKHMMLVMNEGVLRQGQNALGAFDGLASSRDFAGLLKAGAKPVFMRRLPCMDVLREQRADIFAVATGQPQPRGTRPRATLVHMARKWIEDSEAEHVRAKTVEWLP